MTIWAPRTAAALATAVMLAATLTAAAAAAEVNAVQYGNPGLPPPQRGLLPSMRIAEPAGWGDRRPLVPQG